MRITFTKGGQTAHFARAWPEDLGWNSHEFRWSRAVHRQQRVFVAVIWLERKDGEKWVRSKVRLAGEKMALTAGSYRAKGWNRKSHSYDDVAFTVAVGDEIEIVLRNKE